jgi:hypothetical protein
VWQLFHRFVPEGRQSLAAASLFLTKTIAGAKGAVQSPAQYLASSGATK